jgi:cytochrome c
LSLSKKNIQKKYPKKIKRIKRINEYPKRINGYPKRIKRIKRISKKDTKRIKNILFG